MSSRAAPRSETNRIPSKVSPGPRYGCSASNGGANDSGGSLGPGGGAGPRGGRGPAQAVTVDRSRGRRPNRAGRMSSRKVRVACGRSGSRAYTGRHTDEENKNAGSGSAEPRVKFGSGGVI